MIRSTLAVVIFITTISAFGQDAKSHIIRTLERQQQCWNQGDINCFMKGYWESDSLMFVSSEKVYYGYEKTLQRYLDSYPDREAMGKLTFDFISMKPLGDDAFFVIGSFHLERSIGDAKGHFTLLWKRINGEWVIVADHSS